jgi:ABC-type nitrate/sulfonate/bicarbonate transport system substrate-binding protein
MTRRFLAALGAALILAIGEVPARADNPPPITLTVGYGAAIVDAIGFADNPVMRQIPDLFDRIGLKIDPVNVQIGQVAALLESGNPGVVSGTGFGPVVIANRQGAKDVKIFIGVLERAAYELVVRKGITQPAQIKTLGVAAVNSASAQICEGILGKSHLVPDKDYTVVLLGESGARVAAVAAGKVDGSCELLPYPERYHDELGLTVLARATAPDGQILPFATGAWAFNTKWAADPVHHEALVRLAECWLASVQWMYDPKNREAAIGLAQTGFKVSRPVAEAFYRALIDDRILSPDGTMTKGALDGVAQTMVAIGEAAPDQPYSQYFDYSYLREAGRRLHIKVRVPDY